MAKQDSIRYMSLVSQAEINEYYATCQTNGLSPERRAWYASKAEKLRAEAEALPDDFVDPEWRMPDWGTRGT